MQVAPFTINGNVYAPRGISTDLSTLVAQGPTGESSKVITLSFSAPTNRRPTTRVDLSLKFPLHATDASGVTTVRGVALFKGYFVLPEVMSSSDRDTFMATVQAAFAEPAIASYVVALDPLWG